MDFVMYPSVHHDISSVSGIFICLYCKRVIEDYTIFLVAYLLIPSFWLSSFARHNQHATANELLNFIPFEKPAPLSPQLLFDNQDYCFPNFLHLSWKSVGPFQNSNIS